MHRTSRRECSRAILITQLLALPLSAQSLAGPDYNGIRQWGGTHFDTDSRRLPSIDIDADEQLSAIIRSDGGVYVQGQEAHQECRAPAGAFCDIDIGYQVVFGLRTDGTVVVWGEGAASYVIPSLPNGVVYTGVAAGQWHAVLTRSDGAVEAIGLNWSGQLNVPAVPPGVLFRKVRATRDDTIALLSDGSVVVWGDNTYGQTSVPALPPGVIYTDVSCGHFHCLALRSDGRIEAWGDNSWGELNVPPLPNNTSYGLIAAGSSASFAWRSDGVLLGWGRNDVGQLDVPVAPAGATCVQIEATLPFGMARWSDGSVTGWGNDSYCYYGQPLASRGGSVPTPGDRFADASAGFANTLVLRADGTAEGFGDNSLGQNDIPGLPPNTGFTKARSGAYLSALLRSDGELIVWGANQNGQAAVPPLPPGVAYTDFEVSWSHTVAMRSDGEVIAFGLNTAGQCTIPVPPPGLRYEQVDAHYQHTLLLRSDGQVVHTGAPAYGGVSWSSLIQPPTVGLRYTEVSAGVYLQAALLSDGTVSVWAVGSPASWVPALPWGTYYVEVDCQDTFLFLRRSDGRVVVGGPPLDASRPQNQPPALLPGSSYLELDGNSGIVAARVGPTCTYTGLFPGCSGTLRPARLVPRDCPKVGSSMAVGLFDLPHDVAIMVMGWQAIRPPIDLAGFGMPGCHFAISADATVGLSGQYHHAVWHLPIPNQPQLVGLQFFNQALVLDFYANAVGVVVSDAMRGIVGYP